MTELKKGKRLFVADDRDFKLEKYVDVEAVLKKAPANFGHELGISDWGMLGNDKYGDCTCAGACHEHMVWEHEAGKTVKFTDADALGLYSAVTGFNPDEPDTDQGANVRDVLNYRRKTGVKDSTGKRHKIDGFLLLEQGNIDHLLAAAYVFGAVGLGFRFPDFSMQQFDQGKAWTLPAHNPQPHPNEGHYVPLFAKRNGYLKVGTWGKLQSMSVPYWLFYGDETWALYSKELLNAQGKSPEGLDVKALNAQLAAL